MKHKITVTSTDDGSRIFTLEHDGTNYTVLRSLIRDQLADISFVSKTVEIKLTVEEVE